MLSTEAHQKVTARHLRRDAYLYVRQSHAAPSRSRTPRARSASMRCASAPWRWAGRPSGSSSSTATSASRALRQWIARASRSSSPRSGWARGIVLGLEVSRLARNSTDWHRLLEICALTDTLILDEDGIYDPAHFNDRLLLGLKGTMSEAELHVLRARLRGGILNKARRGELRCRLPIGLVYDAERARRPRPRPAGPGERPPVLPDLPAHRLGHARRSSHFRKQGLLFPARVGTGRARARSSGVTLSTRRALHVLHNPCYAGAFVLSDRSQPTYGGDGPTSTSACRATSGIALIRDAHPGYISWDEYEEHRAPPARERAGPRCTSAAGARRAKARRCCRAGDLRALRRADDGPLSTPRTASCIPDYVCQRRGSSMATPVCQSIIGDRARRAPSAICWSRPSRPWRSSWRSPCSRSSRSRVDEADRLRQRQVERAQYEADLARRRYHAGRSRQPPRRRLARGRVERRSCARSPRRRTSTSASAQPTGSCSTKTSASASSRSPPTSRALWRDPTHPDRERKRMLAAPASRTSRFTKMPR